MDQNTNNSFTSAPQGGDYSDIIIPNAYAAKPKNKNLKKYVVFGVMGLVVLFLIGLIAKAIFVNPRTMSKEELLKISQSEDMQKIDTAEIVIASIYAENHEFDEIMNSKIYNQIANIKQLLEQLKQKLENKKLGFGDKNKQKVFDRLINVVDKRLQTYSRAVAVYSDFYLAYINLDSKYIEKYNEQNDKTDYIISYKKIYNLIETEKELGETVQKFNCRYVHNTIEGPDICIEKYNLWKISKNSVEDSHVVRKIFNGVYSNVNDEEKGRIADYIDICLAGVN